MIRCEAAGYVLDPSVLPVDADAFDRALSNATATLFDEAGQPLDAQRCR